MNEIEVQGTGLIMAAGRLDATLSTAARDRLTRSVPEGTARNYAGDWRRFTAWCTDQDRTPLPATAETLAEYVSHLADRELAPSTIERAIAAILVAHTTAGAAKPNTTLARSVLRTHKRDRAQDGRKVRKAAPMTVSNIRAIVASTDTDAAGVRDIAVIVLGFAIAGRRSELAALDVDDLVPTDNGYDVHIRTSKTDKESEGKVVPVPYGTNSETCPVRTVQRWLAVLAADGRTSGPLFVRIDRHGVLGRVPHGRGDTSGRFTGQAVGILIDRAARRAGLDPKLLWSGHSLRRGFATEAYSAGADALRVSRHGRWVDGSRAFLGYVEEVDRVRNNPLTGVGL